MIRGIFFVCFIAALANQANSQLAIGFSGCADLDTAPTVDTARYVASPWFYDYSFPNLGELFTKCSKQTLQETSNTTLAFTIAAQRFGRPTITPATVVLNPKKNGGLETVQTSILGLITLPVDIKYYILDTDYDTYSIAYSCNPIIGPITYQFSWVLKRDRTASVLSNPSVQAALRKYRVPQAYYVKQDQNGCTN